MNRFISHCKWYLNTKRKSIASSHREQFLNTFFIKNILIYIDYLLFSCDAFGYSEYRIIYKNRNVIDYSLVGNGCIKINFDGKIIKWSPNIYNLKQVSSPIKIDLRIYTINNKMNIVKYHKINDGNVYDSNRWYYHGMRLKFGYRLIDPNFAPIKNIHESFRGLFMNAMKERSIQYNTTHFDDARNYIKHGKKMPDVEYLNTRFGDIFDKYGKDNVIDLRSDKSISIDELSDMTINIPKHN